MSDHDLFELLDTSSFEELAYALKSYSRSLRRTSYNTKLEPDERQAAAEAAGVADALANSLFHLHILLDK